MNKRLSIIIGILILALIGAGGYWYYLKQGPKNNTSNGLQAKRVSEEQMLSPIPSFDNSAVWFFNSEGRLFRVKTDGTALSEFPLPNLTGTFAAALWPKDGSDFIALSTKDGVDYKTYYDSTAKIFVNLASNIQSMDWMPDGKRVVYIWQSSDNVHQSLVLANADGTGFRNIADVFWPDLKVLASPDGTKVLMYRTKINEEINKIYLADVATGAINTVIDAGKNLSAAWLPDSKKIIYAQASDTAYPKLYLYDFQTQTSKDLNINTNINKTLIDKDSKYLYASVPKKDNSADTFVKLDLNTLQQETYFDPTSPIRGVNLMLLGNTLYFINSGDGKLYSIEK